MLRVYTGRGRLMQAALSELLRRADARTQLRVVKDVQPAEQADGFRRVCALDRVSHRQSLNKSI